MIWKGIAKAGEEEEEEVLVNFDRGDLELAVI
jgi:hypothetical protein